jgi:hypothetical protein
MIIPLQKMHSNLRFPYQEAYEDQGKKAGVGTTEAMTKEIVRKI